MAYLIYFGLNLPTTSHTIPILGLADTECSAVSTFSLVSIRTLNLLPGLGLSN